MNIDIIEVKRRLLTFLKETSLVDEYITQFGPTIDVKHIKTIKEYHNRKVHPIENDISGEEPVFEILVKCPVCNQDEITSYELRAKSQQIVQNKFLVSIYNGANGFRTIDYTLLAVTICPRCLFASPDRKDFGRYEISSHSDQKSQLSNNVISLLQEKLGERQAILKFTDSYKDYFKRPRGFEPAIDSYRLSMLRAKVEVWHEQPYSYYKLGAYSLRIAKIMKDNFADNQSALKDALNYFEEAFRTSNCPSEDIEMQVIYLIVALYLKTGDQKKANSYIGVFNNLHNARITEMRENPKLTTATIDRWADKAKSLWENRDMQDLFINE